LQRKHGKSAIDGCSEFKLGNIIFGLVNIDPNDYFCLKVSDNTRLRGNPYKITVNHCRLNVRRNFFSERVFVAWNSLPPSVVNFRVLKTVTNANMKLFTTY